MTILDLQPAARSHADIHVSGDAVADRVRGEESELLRLGKRRIPKLDQDSDPDVFGPGPASIRGEAGNAEPIRLRLRPRPCV